MPACEFSQLSFPHLSKMKRDRIGDPGPSQVPGAPPGADPAAVCWSVARTAGPRRGGEADRFLQLAHPDQQPRGRAGGVHQAGSGWGRGAWDALGSGGAAGPWFSLAQGAVVTVQGKVQAAGRVSPALGAGGSGRRESLGALGERLQGPGPL